MIGIRPPVLPPHAGVVSDLLAFNLDLAAPLLALGRPLELARDDTPAGIPGLVAAGHGNLGVFRGGLLPQDLDLARGRASVDLGQHRDIWGRDRYGPARGRGLADVGGDHALAVAIGRCSEDHGRGLLQPRWILLPSIFTSPSARSRIRPAWRSKVPSTRVRIRLVRISNVSLTQRVASANRSNADRARISSLPATIRTVGPLSFSPRPEMSSILPAGARMARSPGTVKVVLPEPSSTPMTYHRAPWPMARTESPTAGW